MMENGWMSMIMMMNFNFNLNEENLQTGKQIIIMKHNCHVSNSNQNT